VTEEKQGFNLILISAVVLLVALVALSPTQHLENAQSRTVEKPTKTGEVLAKVSANNIVLEVRKYSSDKDFTKVSLAAFEYGLFKYFLEEAYLVLKNYENNSASPLYRFYSISVVITSNTLSQSYLE